jgi:hypothetical protein
MPIAPYAPERGAVLTDSSALRVLDQCSRNVPEGLTGQWTPERTHLDHLEAVLPAAIASTLARVIYKSGASGPSPADYYRQYAGVWRNGRRFIYVNGVHSAWVDDTDATHLRHDARSGSPADSVAWWRRSAFVICDGGLASFGALYDVETGRVTDVEFNGRLGRAIELRPERSERPQN